MRTITRLIFAAIIPLALLTATHSASAQTDELPPTVIDPCVYEYLADDTVTADGTPALPLPCTTQTPEVSK